METPNESFRIFRAIFERLISATEEEGEEEEEKEKDGRRRVYQNGEEDGSREDSRRDEARGSERSSLDWSVCQREERPSALQLKPFSRCLFAALYSICTSA